MLICLRRLADSLQTTYAAPRLHADPCFPPIAMVRSEWLPGWAGRAPTDQDVARIVCVADNDHVGGQLGQALA